MLRDGTAAETVGVFVSGRKTVGNQAGPTEPGASIEAEVGCEGTRKRPGGEPGAMARATAGSIGVNQHVKRCSLAKANTSLDPLAPSEKHVSDEGGTDDEASSEKKA